ncbi:MAG: dimethylglycine dehydrogenase [Rhodospirillaceae bacterium]|nr:dimethylglycine dehydrogenase [Rhodospirillaceae bacterium]|tara:strand:- start:35507 stop:37957 length:2451 start_codon:yes stop_codon:yes gene_type:complete
MKKQVKVLVIGGGVVGLSTLYHLTKKGLKDVALCERTELTAGSTWHAAGLLPLFNLSYSVGQIHKYSLNLYKQLEKETGQDVGLRQVGNIRLARNKDRMDEYEYYSGVAKTIGVKVEFLKPNDIKDIWPLCNTNGLIGGIFHPEDGYIQPADLSQAFAIGARNAGAEIYRRTKVEKIKKLKNELWEVTTNKGTILSEHIISCSGNHARQTGKMIGIDIPVLPVEHQYLVTEPHPEILKRQEKGLPEMGVLRESDYPGSYYMREERGGLILGPYEKGAPACFLDGPPENFENDLFPGDLDRLEVHIEAAINRVPAFGEVGVKQVINGPIAYTPDGSPLIGPAWNVKNFWINEGHSFGITAAGGAGWQIAEWLVNGEPSIDMMGVDPRRFGPYASKGYLKLKNEEAYENVFVIHFPDEERPAARPLKQSPCYERMKKLGAVFGQLYGWERPNWFISDNSNIKEKWSFRRSNYFKYVGDECKNVHSNVGILDMTAFSKFLVTGRDSENWLNKLLSNSIPDKIGKISLSYLLTKDGGVRSEFTVYKKAESEFYLVSAGAMERHDMDYLFKSLPNNNSVSLNNLTNSMGVLVIAGPNSRKVLQKITNDDLSNQNFPWLSGKEISISAASVDALRVNFVGELGWEIHHPIGMQNYIFDLIMKAGAEFNIKPFGIRAMDSLRLEKSYRLIPRELSIEYSALESNLDRFIDFNKKDFIGKKALLETKQKGFKNIYVTATVDGIIDADARGSEPIYFQDKLVGRATSGGFGWRINKSIVLAMVDKEFSEINQELDILILGKKYRTKIIQNSPYDNLNLRLKDKNE